MANNRYIPFLFLVTILILVTDGFGQNERSSDSAQGENTEFLICEVYQDVLKREPDPEGLAHFKIQLQDEKKDRQWLVATLKNGKEHQANLKEKQEYRAYKKQLYYKQALYSCSRNQGTSICPWCGCYCWYETGY